MRIIISNFKCYGEEPSEFQFSKGKITLLRGDSGSGKTTILEAIKWCLYGGNKNIYPKGKTPKCYVKLEINENFSVYRQKNPSILKVESVTDGKTVEYEDVAAQNIIEDLYGSKDVWYSSSYISQKSRNHILTVAPNGKIDILNKLSFHGEDPRECIDKINNKIKEYNNEYKSSSSLLNNDIKEFNEKTEKEKPDMKTYLNDEEYEKEKETHRSNKELLQSLIQKQIEQASRIGTYKTLKQRKAVIDDKLSALEEFDENALQILNEELKETNQYIHNTKELASVRHDLSCEDYKGEKLEDIQEAYEEIAYTEEDLSKAREKESRRNENKTKCGIACVSYDQNSIQTAIQDIEDTLKIQNNIQNLHNERQIYMNNYEKELTNYNERKEAYIKQKQLEHKSYINDLNKIYEETHDAWMNRKNKHDRSFEENLKQYKKRKEAFENRYKYLLKEFKDRKEKHEKSYQNSLAEFRNRYENAKRKFEEEVAKYINRKNKFEEKTRKSLEYYNSRIDQTRKEFDLRQKEEKVLREQYKDLISKPISSEEDVIKQTLYIEKLKSYRDIMECPHCHSGVRLKDGSLESAQNPISNIEEDIRKQETFLVEIKNGDYRLKQIKNLENEIRMKKVPSWEEYSKHIEKPSTEEFDEEKPVFVFEEKEPLKEEFEEKEPLKEEFEEKEPLKEEFEEKEPVREQIKPLEILFEEKEPTLSIPPHLKDIEEPINVSTVNTLKRDIVILKNVVYYEEVVPSSSHIYNKLQLKNRLNKLLIHIKIYEECKKKLENSRTDYRNVSQIEKDIKSCSEGIYSKKNLQNETLEIEQKIKNIEIDESLDEKVKNFQEEINNKDKFLEDSVYARFITSEKNKLKQRRQYLIDLNTKIEATNKLKILARNIETYFLDSVVSELNRHLSIVLPSIFDEPIEVTASLIKEMKSSNKTKISFNLVCVHDGKIHDSLEEMSTGEIDRISIAITIALNMISNSPILMLDETITSIQTDLRDRCINIIRNNIVKNKSIVSTTHESIEGHYDECITLNPR